MEYFGNYQAFSDSEFLFQCAPVRSTLQHPMGHIETLLIWMLETQASNIIFINFTYNYIFELGHELILQNMTNIMLTAIKNHNEK